MKLLLTLFLFLGFFPLQAQSFESEPSVVLYYLPSCPHSMRVIDYLEKIHKTVAMENLQNNLDGKVKLRSILGNELRVPCLVVDNQPILGEEPIIEWIKEHQSSLKSTNKKAS